MKKALLSLFSFLGFLLLCSTTVKAQDYNGNLGYTYSTSSTIFWFVTDNENLDKIYLHVESFERVEMEEYSTGVYMYALGGNLKDKEYYYSVCNGDNCIDVLDPFSKVLNDTGTKNVIVPSANTTLEGWTNVKTLSVNSYNKAIYAIEADKFAQNLTLKDNNEVLLSNSVFSKISNPSNYEGSSSQKYVGYEYLEKLGIKYLEIGDLYNQNNYFYPNLEFCDGSCDNELKNAILNFKKIKLNVIARVNFLNISDSFKNILETYSTGYIKDNKINIENPVMKKYIKDVFLHWVREYKVDGFYILDAQSYGNDFLNELKQLLLEANPNLFIYTDQVNNGQYYTSDKLQQSLFGNLIDYTSKGLASNDFSQDKVNDFINGVFGGYYNDLTKYDNAAKIINNIGDFKGLDIYSKMSLALATVASDSVIKDKISLGLMAIFTSVGIPRLVAGNEFFNNNIIPTGQVDSIDSENKVCRENTKLCYLMGDEKKLDWVSLINNDSETVSFMGIRTTNVANYPSVYSMSKSTAMSYNSSLINQGLLLLTIDYPQGNVGEIEQTMIIINFSDINHEIGVDVDNKGIGYSSYIGTIVSENDKYYIQPLTLVVITKAKVNNTPAWVYIVIMFILLVIIFGTRYLCMKMFKVKYNVEYDDYEKQKRLKNKKEKKKKAKTSEVNVFKQFWSDEPIFKFKKKVTTESQKNESNTNQKEDNNK